MSNPFDDENLIGKRVVCINDSEFNGLHGVVEGAGPFGYFVNWDDVVGKAGSTNQGGIWATSDFALESEYVEGVKDTVEPDRIAVLEGAVAAAQGIFEHYAELHSAKGPEGFVKAYTNLGYAKLMQDALETD